MCVREIEERDLAAFKQLFIEYYRELDCEDDPLSFFDDLLLPDLRAGLFRAAIFEDGGQIGGFVIFQIDDVINDWNFFEGWGDVRELYVAPSFRNRGAGRALLKYAEEKLKADGADKAYLLPTEPHEKFFIGCGFADDGDYCPELDNKVFTKNLS